MLYQHFHALQDRVAVRRTDPITTLYRSTLKSSPQPSMNTGSGAAMLPAPKQGALPLTGPLPMSEQVVRTHDRRAKVTQCPRMKSAQTSMLELVDSPRAGRPSRRPTQSPQKANSSSAMTRLTSSPLSRAANRLCGAPADPSPAPLGKWSTPGPQLHAGRSTGPSAGNPKLCAGRFRRCAMCCKVLVLQGLGAERSGYEAQLCAASSRR